LARGCLYFSFHEKDVVSGDIDTGGKLPPLPTTPLGQYAVGVDDTSDIPLNCKSIVEFSKKFVITLMSLSEVFGRRIHDKTRHTNPLKEQHMTIAIDRVRRTINS
jgi:hypothetical protein